MLKIPGKIPVSIYPFFWLLAFLIGWLNTASLPATLIWVAIILLSVLVHEFGHALTALAFGQKAQIELVGFGGVTQRRGGGHLKLWKEFMIVLNGPLAGFCLALVAWAVHKFLASAHPSAVLTYAFEVTFYVNLFWTFLNLLPVQPLDGGKLFSIFFEAMLGLKGIKIALFISVLLAGSLALFFFGTQQFFAGAIFMLFTFESYKSWKESLLLTEEDKSFILQHLFKEAERDLHTGNKGDALNKFLRVTEMAKVGVLYQTASENAARLLAEKNELNQAYDLLATLGKNLSPQALSLFHQLSYFQGKWKEVIALGNRVYHSLPTYQVAMMNATAHGALGNVKPAIGWIQSAIHEGIPNLKEVLANPVFDPIRMDPQFRSFLENIKF